MYFTLLPDSDFASAAPPAARFLWFYILLPPLLTQFKQAAVCRWLVLIPDMNLTLLQ